MKTLFTGIFLLLLALPARNQSIHPYAVDSLTRLVALQKEDTVKVKLLYRLAYHRYFLDTSAGKRTNEGAAALSEKLHYSLGTFRYLYNRGDFAENEKQYARAIVFYTEAADFAKKNGLYPETHEAYTCLLNMYFYRGEYVNALAVCLDGMKRAEEKHDVARQANYANLLGFIYRNMNNAAPSEKAYRDYLRFAERSGDSLLVASAYTEMAEVYISKQQYDSSLLYLFNAFDLYAGNNERHRRAYIFYLVSQTYKAAGQPDSAWQYATKAIDYTRRVPANQYDIARYYIAAGELLVRRGNARDAIALLDTGLRISQAIYHHENMRDAYRFLSEAYAQLGNFSEAYRFQLNYRTLKDSLLNEKNLKTIAEMQALYALQKKDREIEFLNRQKKLEADEARRKSWIRNLAIGVAALLVVVGFLFYNRYRLEQKNAYQLTINRQQNELFQSIVSAQEKERQRIAGNLHDGLGSLLSAAKLQLGLAETEQLPPTLQENYRSVLSLIQHASEELRNISHAIMPAALSKLGLPATLENVITGLGPATGIRFSFHAHDFDTRPGETIELSLYHITMELINNIVKHSGATTATVQLVRHPAYINLTVEDNGKGFDRRHRGNGIGLANIGSRVEFLGGQLEIDSTPGSGATISIDIPIR